MDRVVHTRRVAAHDRIGGEFAKRRVLGQVVQLFLSRKSALQENLRQRSVALQTARTTVSTHRQHQSLVQCHGVHWTSQSWLLC